jgi:choline kinase
VHVAGRPLIEHVLASLSDAGVDEAVLVLGYHGDQVMAALGNGARHGMRLRYAWNPDHTTGNGTSLSRALPLVAGEPFLLVMSDHLCSPELLRTLVREAGGGDAIAVDRSELSPQAAAEATKVTTARGQVVDLGKDLLRWDAVDTGFSHWAPGAFTGHTGDGELAALMANLARSGRAVLACDVSGFFWHDVDTEDDIRHAEALLRNDVQPVP